MKIGQPIARTIVLRQPVTSSDPRGQRAQLGSARSAARTHGLVHRFCETDPGVGLGVGTAILYAAGPLAAICGPTEPDGHDDLGRPRAGSKGPRQGVLVGLALRWRASRSTFAVQHGATPHASPRRRVTSDRDEFRLPAKRMKFTPRADPYPGHGLVIRAVKRGSPPVCGPGRGRRSRLRGRQGSAPRSDVWQPC